MNQNTPGNDAPSHVNDWDRLASCRLCVAQYPPLFDVLVQAKLEEQKGVEVNVFAVSL